MRLCKDQLTGEKRPQNELYRADNGKYYTSESAYNKYRENLDYKSKCNTAIFEILDYKDFMKLPRVWFVKLSEWEGYGYKVVYNTLLKQVDKIKYAIKNKDFKSESAKFMYISAIIENNLTDTLKEIAREEKEKRIAEENKDIDFDMSSINRTQTTKDISNWLED